MRAAQSSGTNIQGGCCLAFVTACGESMMKLAKKIMHCCNGGGSEPAPIKDSGGKKKPLLLDGYSLGDVIGQGAFGIVYACKRLDGTGEERAVKMIDKVESTLAEIQHEEAMLRKLAHTSIVRLHEVYYERVFVCMVMDVYRGGDLISGMQGHWEKKGMIPPGKLPAVYYQMLRAIAWLHEHQCVHRDIKGDNYLLDRPDIVDPDLRIFLSDFGTVEEVKPGKRLSKKCGTRIYWAPEVFQMSYALKVDVWATGVICYGLVNGKFPFKPTEADVKCKSPRLPSSCPKECADFILQLLAKKEAERVDAAAALKHPWLANTGIVQDNDMHQTSDFTPEAVGEKGVNPNADERRRMLVMRLQKQQGMKTQKVSNPAASVFKKFMKSAFDSADRRRHRGVVSYEWWTVDKAKKAGLLSHRGTSATMEDPASANSVDVVKNMLADYGVSTDGFGKGQAKTLKAFATEVQLGEAYLMLDAARYKCMVRVVDTVLLRIRDSRGRVLVTMSEQSTDGRKVSDIYLFPGAKRQPHENLRQTAGRVVRDRLHMSDCAINFDWENRFNVETEEESPSYPGVRTVYNKVIIEGTLETTNALILERIGLGAASGLREFSAQDKRQTTRTFRWLTEREITDHKVEEHLKPGMEISALVPTSMGLDEDDLKALLVQSNVDVTKYGTGKGKSIEAFSDELIGGRAALERQPDGSLLRVVDSVQLIITKPTGEILVETRESFEGGRSEILNRLPTERRRPDENQCIASWRLIQHRILGVDDDFDVFFVNISPTDVRIFEETVPNEAYPGVRCKYRTRILQASVVQ
eukprot:TRINITY_DN63797_c0_g1_i1.p1 TRINITY_DN63797_c0_g1~~TRINITY_DN63797_c0_g1_i1.p1  ORF type:complete len:808 (-),score=184.96 TRINITY_DN63797_c0_g1_i1:239-2662(-)